MDTLAIDKIYAEIKRNIDTKTINPISVMDLIHTVMAEVERLKSTTGSEKKLMVVHIIDKLLSEIPAEDDATRLLIAGANLLAPSLIDMVVSATKGKLDINTPTAKCCAII
jgi:hypothetical protein